MHGNEFTALDAQTMECALATLRPDELPDDGREDFGELIEARWRNPSPHFSRCRCRDCQDKSDSWDC